MAKLLTNLQDCAHTIVYQMVVAAIKADPVMAATVGSASWTTYTEDACIIRNNAIENNGFPCICMLPFSGPISPEANVIQNADLGIAVTVSVAGHDVRDLMNLWAALSRAIFTGDGTKTLANSIRAALKAAGDAQSANVGSLQTFYLGLSAINPSTDSQGSKFCTAEGVLVAKMTVPK